MFDGGLHAVRGHGPDGAAGKTAFLAAAQASAEGRTERLRLSPMGGFRRWAVEVWTQRQLQPAMVVRSDGLRCFRGVQAAGCEHQPRITVRWQG